MRLFDRSRRTSLSHAPSLTSAQRSGSVALAVSRPTLLTLVLVSLVGCGRVSYRALDAGVDASMDAFGARDAGPDAFVPGVDGGSDSGADAGRDASAPDATILPATCPVDAFFCDGYDDGTFAAWSFPVTVGGSVSSATTPVHSGARSLRCVSDGGSAVEARYGAFAYGGQTSGDLWARAYFYLPAVLPDFVSLISISDSAPPFTGAAMVVTTGLLGVTSGISADRAFDTVPIPRERWVCVEFHITADPLNGVLEAYRDGALVARVAGFNTVPDSGYEVAEIGIHYVVSGPAFELYVDDVALSRVRVGCL